MFSGITLHSTEAGGAGFTAEALAASHGAWAVDVPLLREAVDDPVLIFDRCTSTMELAARLAEEGELPAWGAVLAVVQESGRGQMRRWWSSEAGNLHASFLVPDVSAADPLWNRLLPLVLGWCVRNGLRELGAETVLKWPNDLVQLQGTEYRKTCGLLMEDRAGRTVAGLGLNLFHAPEREKLREGSAFNAGILEFSNGQPSPLGLWLKLVKIIKKEYQALLDHSHPRDFVSRLSGQLLWMGEAGVLEEQGGPRMVRLAGLAPDGGLRVRNLDGEGQEEVLYSGSISKKFQADVCP